MLKQARCFVLKDVSGSGARLEVDGSTDVLKSREFFMTACAIDRPSSDRRRRAVPTPVYQTSGARVGADERTKMTREQTDCPSHSRRSGVA
jgi:hypothetical protein